MDVAVDDDHLIERSNSPAGGGTGTPEGRQVPVGLSQNIGQRTVETLAAAPSYKHITVTPGERVTVVHMPQKVGIFPDCPGPEISAELTSVGERLAEDERLDLDFSKTMTAASTAYAAIIVLSISRRNKGGMKLAGVSGAVCECFHIAQLARFFEKKTHNGETWTFETVPDAPQEKISV